MMQKSQSEHETMTRLDELVGEVTADARGEHEQLCAFRQGLTDHLVLPCDAFVIGEPVSVIAFDYDGNVRRGLTARCRRADGAEYQVAAADVVVSPRTDGGRYLARTADGWDSNLIRRMHVAVRLASTKSRRPTSTSTAPSSCWFSR